MDRQKQSNKLRMSYDKEADVLYLSLGSPKAAISDIDENGIIVRRDPETKKVVGLTVVDFLLNFSSAKAKLLSPHLSAKLQYV